MVTEDRRRQKEQEAKDKGEEPPKPKAEDPEAAEFTDSKGRKHKGILKIDATCADAEVRCPTDATLLETSCRKIDEYTSKVCQEFGIKGFCYLCARMSDEPMCDILLDEQQRVKSHLERSHRPTR